MMTVIYIRGLLMGLAYVAPIGMQNLFVIHTALNQPWKRVLATAAVVCFFDISLGLACFGGVGLIITRFPMLNGAILGVGSLLVIAIGIGLWRAKAELRAVDTNVPFMKAALTAFVVTWLNPQAILDGTMILGAFQVGLNDAECLRFIAGFSSASFLWFMSVSVLVHRVSAIMTVQVLNGINKICAAVLLFYGGKLLWQFG